MKYIIATIKPVIALVLCLSTSITVADGRDAGASAYTTSGHGYSDPLRWSDKGYGGWRTHGSHGWVQDDKGYAVYDVGFDICRLACEVNHNCKGVEYISTPYGGWSENGYWVQNKCEIHYDHFAHCDTSGGGKGTWDGCWVKTY
ncbi:MAG: hypothetical protein BWK73_41605 [Thiothrix lacustris]|jgi:hypothetical protein|uniref:Apple domain-containing protein n=1 Tax=Thiothrix lacustris TaxID=525917 RepID=A0A1Y1QD23_9GAMM|nr:MAG: hypothetical protein BWK73_41605 [Thiothrix lacustris]